jgi:hypothetical protein
MDLTRPSLKRIAAVFAAGAFADRRIPAARLQLLCGTGSVSDLSFPEQAVAEVQIAYAPHTESWFAFYRL